LPLPARIFESARGYWTIVAAVSVIYETLKALREEPQPPSSTTIASAELMRQAMRDDDCAGWTRDFLGSGS